MTPIIFSLVLAATAAPPDWREISIESQAIYAHDAEMIRQTSSLFHEAYEPAIGKLRAENKLVMDSATAIYREASKVDASAVKVRLLWRELVFATNRLNTHRAALETQAKATKGDQAKVGAAQFIDTNVRSIQKRADQIWDALRIDR